MAYGIQASVIRSVFDQGTCSCQARCSA